MISVSTKQKLYDEAIKYKCESVQDFRNIMKGLVKEDHTITLENMIIMYHVLNLHFKEMIANYGDKTQVIWFIEQIINSALNLINMINVNVPLGVVAKDEIHQVIELSRHLIEVENGMFDH
jgi:hypothetical protein